MLQVLTPERDCVVWVPVTPIYCNGKRRDPRELRESRPTAGQRQKCALLHRHSHLHQAQTIRIEGKSFHSKDQVEI